MELNLTVREIMFVVISFTGGLFTGLGLKFMFDLLWKLFEKTFLKEK